MPDDLMSGYPSTRTTLCLLAGLGALTGGVAGAAIVGKLATDDSVGAAVARDKPATVSATRAMQVAAVAAQSPSRLPTPWSAADVKAAGAAGERPRVSRQAAPRKQAPQQIAVRSTRTRATPTAPTRSGATRVTRTGSSPPPVSVAPRPSTPVQQPARSPVRSPAPARAPNVSRPSPEPAPVRATPKPDPTGAFDDSG
jgi:hypothetical protein